MPKKKPAGKLVANGMAILILRSGQVITNAKVMDKAFRVATSDLGTLTIKVEQISSIVYKNPPNFQTDFLRTLGGSEINGEVLNDPVNIQSADLGGAVAIAKAKIAHITF